jgi:hypothetical protein
MSDLQLQNLQRVTPWQVFGIPRLLVAAFILLSVLAWIEFLLWDYPRSTPGDGPGSFEPNADRTRVAMYAALTTTLAVIGVVALSISERNYLERKTLAEQQLPFK